MFYNVIYAVDNGDLKRYFGVVGGQTGVGVIIATGWSDYKSYFTGVVGEIFAITPGGALWRFVDTGSNTLGPGTPIGSSGWGSFLSVFYGGNNNIYAITTDGQLKHYLVDGNANIGDGNFIGYGSWQTVKVVQ